MIATIFFSLFLRLLDCCYQIRFYSNAIISSVSEKMEDLFSKSIGVVPAELHLAVF